ncbi:hypothetical protein KPSB59_3370003 [Klebsiella quasipneumoniae subsp. quasipneumoniae]|nr:hypothetical protein KPSB59_3370003 [Klebsiella quasipneumoniae subsp. quasipneumoniae]
MDLIVMVEQAVGEGINSRYRCSRLADCRRHILHLRRPGDARLVWLSAGRARHRMSSGNSGS